MDVSEDDNYEVNPDNDVNESEDLSSGDEVGEEKTRDPNLAAKIIAGIGGLLAGAFIAKKLLKRDESGGNRNPILQHLGDKKKVAELVSDMQRRRDGAGSISPGPRDYAANLEEASDPVRKEIFERGLHAKGEHRYHEAVDLFEKVLSGAEGVERAALLSMIGNCHYSESMFREALEKHSRACEEAVKAGDKEAEAVCLGNTGIAHLQMHQLDKARRCCEDSLKAFREIGSMEDEADQLYNLAVIYRRSGEAGKALKAQEDALKIHRHRKDKLKEAEGLANLGLIYQQKNDIDAALDCFEHALKLNTQIGNIRGEAEAMGHTGGAYQQKGDLDTALKYEEDALAMHREIGNRDGEANQLGNIGLIYQQRGEFDKALGYFGDALRIHKLLGNKTGEATGLVNIGIIYRKTGNLEKALECQREALKIFTAIGARTQTEIIHQNIKRIHEMMTIRKVDAADASSEA